MRFTNFEHMLRHNAENYPDRTAFYYEKDGKKSVTYRRFYEEVLDRKALLEKRGKTCEGIFSDGSYDAVVEIFAAVLAGYQVVMLERTLPETTLQYLLSYADIDCLYGPEALTSKLEPRLSQGVKDGRGNILFFTSGTTSVSKGVLLTDTSLCNSAYNGGSLLPLTKDDILLCILPLNHVFGFVCGILWGFSCQASVALGRGARHYLDDFAFYEPTAVSVVPMLLGFFLKNHLINDACKLILIGAGDCPSVYFDMVKALGKRVSYGYGLTETSSGVALSLGDDPLAMTICPDDRIRIDEGGEILIDVPTCIMKGYYKYPMETAEVLRGGMLHTGDLGTFDADGKLHITGRIKEILVLADGTKIFLPEYEERLRRVFPTEEFAVLLRNGRPVLVTSDPSLTREILWEKTADVMRMIPRGHQLTDVVVLPHPLPRTATGKIKRWAIQKEIDE